MEVIALTAQIDEANVWELILWNCLKTGEFNGLFYNLFRLILGQVSITEPEHATSLEPFCLHGLKRVIIESIEDYLEC